MVPNAVTVSEAKLPVWLFPLWLVLNTVHCLSSLAKANFMYSHALIILELKLKFRTTHIQSDPFYLVLLPVSMTTGI